MTTEHETTAREFWESRSWAAVTDLGFNLREYVVRRLVERVGGYEGVDVDALTRSLAR